MRSSDIRFLIALMASACTGCVAAPPEQNWPRTFEGEIARIAGDGVVDCGFLRLTAKGSSASERRASRECMETARRENRPFKYGTVRVPMDSTAWEVFVHTGQGDYLLVQDEMVLQDFVRRWSQRCEIMMVHERTGIIVAEECSDLPEEAS